MLHHLKIGISVLALSAFVAAPVITVVTADYAYAKNGNGNGNGNGGGGGKGGGNGGGNGNGKSGGGYGDNGGKSRDANGNGHGAEKGKSGFKAEKGKKSRVSRTQNAHGKNGKNKSVARAIKDDFKSLKRSFKNNGIGGIFGKKQVREKTTVRRIETKRTAPVTSVRPAKRASFKDKGTLHPSQLGKLNGAINSSPKAKAAHIANGNYNGPVGLSAALAVADYDLDNIEKSVAEFTNAEETLELAVAFELVEQKPTEQDVIDARTVLDDPAATPEEKEQAQAIVDYPDTTEAEALIEGEEHPDDSDIADALDVIERGIPDDQDIVDAEQAVQDAEEAVLNAYKGNLSDEAQEDLVLTTVRDANPNESAIEDALGKKDKRDDDDISEEEMVDNEDDVLQESTESALTDEELKKPNADQG